jgi:hypothetical protein
LSDKKIDTTSKTEDMRNFREMLAEKKAADKVRYIYVKDAGLSKFGFPTAEAANAEADKMGERDTDERRIRVRLRQRTGLYDVLVKVKREVKPTPKSSETISKATAEAPIGG